MSDPYEAQWEGSGVELADLICPFCDRPCDDHEWDCQLVAGGGENTDSSEDRSGELS